MRTGSPLCASTWTGVVEPKWNRVEDRRCSSL